MKATFQYDDYLGLPITHFYRTLRHIDSRNLTIAAVGMTPVDRARFLAKLKPCVSPQVYKFLEDDFAYASPNEFNEKDKTTARANIAAAITFISNEKKANVRFDLIVRRASLFNFSGTHRCRKCRRKVKIPNELIPLRDEANAGLICTKCSFNMPGGLYMFEGLAENGNGLKTPSPKHSGLVPESRHFITIDDLSIVCTRPDGKVDTVKWADLTSVSIHSTDDGPFAPDMFWVLETPNSGCVIPWGATGEDLLLVRLQELPGFDSAAVISAAPDTSGSKQYRCWTKNTQ